MSGKQKTLYFKDETERALVELSDNLQMSQSAVVDMLIIAAKTKLDKRFPPTKEDNPDAK